MLSVTYTEKDGAFCLYPAFISSVFVHIFLKAYGQGQKGWNGAVPPGIMGGSFTSSSNTPP